MKQVTITKPFEYEVREVEIPEPREGEVLIQMKAAGVCGSDQHIFKGENPNSRYPLIPGHENAGIIAKIGAGVTNIKVGDHVVVDLLIACGECYQCTHERENVCEEITVRGSSADGGWREYFTAPESDVYVIDKNIPWKDAALIEPFTVGSHCCKRGRVTNEDTVIVLGAGTIGSIILQTCKNLGAKVICVDINEENLKRAKKYGADLVVNTSRENLVEKVQEFTNGHCASVAFDSACLKGTLTSLFEPGLIGNAGRIVSLGFCTDPEAISQAMIDQRELDVIGSRMSAYQFSGVAQNMADGKYNLEELATAYIPFSKIDEVFYNIENPTEKSKKMVILFD